MKAIAYYLSLPFIYFFSFLPFPVLYVLSDILVFPLLYYVTGYRRKVVFTNLQNSFPDKSEKELREIEKKFYRYLADLFMETVKFFTISESELKRRYVFRNPEIADQWYEEGRNIVYTLGHYGNYEWMALALDFAIKHRGKGPFREMSNPYFNQLFWRSRARFGTELYPTYKTMEAIRKPSEEPYLVALANDQSAPPDKSYWTTFLNQDTSFFVGTEKIAKTFNMPVLFAAISRVKRGYYEINFEVITHHPKEEPEGDIMEKHARFLENQILNKPEYWLWSHRRWKHKKPEGLEKGFSLKKR
ncbi:lysophospholipid acyltransferase family protein [Jiulongibacter sediminis]|uniref:lysophospholipid acyltransferase family protein n=1 Tax=Jiulongibacter sediminis TaxID=1605367 RepID=UPI0026EEB104|nr:lysophospholipid acyltransferase family protein [Jiulongibacter sediminis]